MLLAVAMFSLMDTGLKLLSLHYPVLQVAALRAMSSLPLVFAYVAWRGAFRSLVKVRWPLHLMRGVLGIAMLSLFTFGLRQLPLAEAYSIFFIAPLVITALSVPFLGERVDSARWIAILVGLVGVVVVLRPTGEGLFTLGGLAVLGAALCYSISAITWGIGLDWAPWHTLPDGFTLLGATIIIASGIYLVRRESVHCESEHP